MGVNVVGLRRAGFQASEMAELKRAYKLLFRAGLALEEALERIAAECPGEHAAKLVAFARGSKRGICRR